MTEDKIKNEELAKIVINHLKSRVPASDLEKELRFVQSFLQHHAEGKIHSYAVLDLYNIAEEYYPPYNSMN